MSFDSTLYSLICGILIVGISVAIASCCYLDVLLCHWLQDFSYAYMYVILGDIYGIIVVDDIVYLYNMNSMLSCYRCHVSPHYIYIHVERAEL